MFTGIVEYMGQVETLAHTAEGGRLVIRAPEVVAAGLAIANSIAVNGCCLTVVELGDGTFAADLSGETLRRTGFGEIKPGTRVNLERPLSAGKEFGGHFVQGHVDGVGRVTRLVPEGENWWYSVRVPQELHRYVAMKGSIALDGISLTVAGWHEGIVDIAIIPFTWTHTNIQQLTVGDPVNVECDILAKYVERLLLARDEATPSRLSMDEVVKQGF
jgi:riboflavin synthase